MNVNSWYIQRLTLTNSDVRSSVLNLDKTEVSYATLSNPEWNNRRIGIDNYNDGSAGALLYVDWIIVRQYTSPEPSIALGPEQLIQVPTTPTQISTTPKTEFQETPTPTTAPTAALTPPAAPALSVSQDPFFFDFGTMSSGETSSQIFTISNAGGGTLTWSISDDQPWININPIAGANSVTVAIYISTVGLSPGSYSGTITVTSNGGTKKGSISLKIPAALNPTTTSTLASTSPLVAPPAALVQII